jgi:outer membrane protein, protease secretion system
MRKTFLFLQASTFKSHGGNGHAASAMTVSAQSSVLDFKQVYQAALEQDATIRASRAAADSGRERLPQARAGLMPQVSASAGRNFNSLDTTSPNILGELGTTNDRYFSDNKSVQLRQPLVNMQRWLQFEQAKSMVAETEATLDRDLQNLVVRVAGAYFETLMADEQLEVGLGAKENVHRFGRCGQKRLGRWLWHAHRH